MYYFSVLTTGLYGFCIRKDERNLAYALFKRRYISFIFSMTCLIAIFLTSGLGHEQAAFPEEYQLARGIVVNFRWICGAVAFCFGTVLTCSGLVFYKFYVKKREGFRKAFQMSVSVLAEAMYGVAFPLLWHNGSCHPLIESLFLWRVYLIVCYIYSWLSYVNDREKTTFPPIDRLCYALMFTPIGAYLLFSFVSRQYTDEQAAKAAGVQECIDRAGVYLDQMAQRDYAGALAEYEQAVRLAPDRPDLYARRAAIYYEQGDYAAALAELGKAIRLAPKSHGLYLQRAKIYFRQGNYAEVVADCTTALQHPVTHAEYWQLGSGYSYQDTFEQAIRAEFYHLRALAYRERGEYEKAISDCKHALENYACSKSKKNDSPSGGTHYCLAETYALQNDYVNALVNYSKAIECNASNPLYYKKRAVAYEKIGNMEKATADLDTVEEMLRKEHPERNRTSLKERFFKKRFFAAASQTYAAVADDEPFGEGDGPFEPDDEPLEEEDEPF